MIKQRNMTESKTLHQERGHRDPRSQGETTHGKTVAPLPSNPKTKNIKERDFHWCTNHKAWTRHTLAKCKKLDFNPKTFKNAPVANMHKVQDNENNPYSSL